MPQSHQLTEEHAANCENCRVSLAEMEYMLRTAVASGFSAIQMSTEVADWLLQLARLSIPHQGLLPSGVEPNMPGASA